MNNPKDPTGAMSYLKSLVNPNGNVRPGVKLANNHDRLLVQAVLDLNARVESLEKRRSV